MKKLLTLGCLVTSLLQWPCHAQLNWSSPPTSISTSGVNASDPHVVIDQNGNATAVWAENGVIQTSSIPSGGSWGTITGISNSGASFPRIGIDSSGNVTATWVESGVVNSSTLPFGGSWSAETALSNSGASTPEIFIDSTGNAVAVWERNGYIESSQKPAGGSWSLVSMLSSVGAEDHPQVCIGGSGAIFAVWHSVSSGADIVVSAQGIVNGSWASPLNIVSASASLHHNYPRIVVDDLGNASAAWYSYDLSGTTYSSVEVLASHFSSTGTSWTTPTELSNPGAYNPADLFLAMGVDSAGNVIAEWTNSYNGWSFGVESAVKPLGQNWVVNGTLVEQDTYAYQGDISVAPSGNAVTAYMYFDGTTIFTQAAETSINGIAENFYSSPVNLSDGLDNAYPRVWASYSSSSGNLNGASVWLNYNGTNTNVQASVGSNALTAPPTSLAVSQSSNNFGVFTEYYNTLTWTTSTDPTIVEYIVYRNGSIVQGIDPDVTEFIDHNAVQSQAVTYGVAAVNGELLLSAVQTVDLP